MSPSQTNLDIDLTSLVSARSTYNAFLMVKNGKDLDEGIINILQLLHVVPFDPKIARQKINKGTVKKALVSATLALIMGSSPEEVWKTHNKIGLPILKDLLTSTYGNNLPQQCEDCTRVYECHEADLCKCVACYFAFCPTCCPNDGGDSRFYHPICSPCLRGIGSKITKVPEEAITAPPSPTALPGPRVQWPGPGRGESTITVTPPSASTLTPTPAPTLVELGPGSPRALGGGKPPSQPPGGPGVTPTGSESSDKAIVKVSDKVCGFYSRSCCKHGSKGEGCSYSHPNKCFKWVKRGLAGCSKGGDCEYYHIKLCKSAAKGAECSNEKCTLPHVAKFSTALPGPWVQWPGPGRGEKPNEKPIESNRTQTRDTNTFAKAKANQMKPPQDFQMRRTPEAPDMMMIKGLLEAVALLTKQMGEMMVRLRTPVSGPQIPALYPHPPPPIQAQHQPTYQAFPYHQHLQQHAVVRIPSSPSQ
jgi:hypothetical protein